MKKILSVLLIVGFYFSGHAQQEYQIDVDFGVKSSLNNVDCYSRVDLTFTQKSGKKWMWTQYFTMGQGQWNTFSRTFSVPANDRIISVTCLGSRVIDQGQFGGGCKTFGEGSVTDSVYRNWYPCFSGTVVQGIPAYDADTYVNMRITPLTNVYAIQLEATSALTDNPDLLRVDVRYDDGLAEEIFERSFTGNITKIKSDRFRKITQLESYTFGITSFLPLRFGWIGPKINKVNDNGVTLDEPVKPFGSGGSVHVFYGAITNSLIVPLEGTPPNQTQITQLPSDNSVTLEVPEAMPEYYAGYNWQYHVQGEKETRCITLPIIGTICSQVDKWVSFASLSSTKKVTFSGKDLFGASWQNYLFKNVSIKAVYCGRSTNIVTLRHVPSAPDIVSVVSTPETCYGSQDAKLKITFDRPLYTPWGEDITIFPNNISSQDFTNLTLDADNSVTVQSTVLTPGAYSLTMMNRFTVINETGYSGGPTHTASTTIPQRLPITNFTATAADVHCNGGQDGRITVSAQGGTSSYTAYLTQSATDLGNISLTETTGNSFTDLPANTYTVTLKDSNGCDPKDVNGSIDVKKPAVGEPAQQLSLSAVDNVEPLGFGLTNGYVSARAQDGTASYNFTWTDAANNSLTADAPVQQGATTLSQLSNIGKGVYYVRAEDANYALASPATEINLRGCYDTLSFNVTQPPLLEVAMAEQHVVSCYNYKDGELVAHAKGGRPYTTGQYDPYMYEWFVVNSPLTAFGTSDSTQLDRFSATYRVKVTDRNGIIAWSPDFKLVQPDPLLIGFNTSQLLCNGDTNGTSTALPTGGTAPYSYQWSTDDVTQSVSNLTDGFYSVVVQDIRKCTTYDQTEVTVPNSLMVSPQVKQPTCNNYSDGSIQLNAGGGKPGYTYVWQHGPSTDLIQNLGQGSYEVKVTDANGCFILRDFSLDNPGLLPVDLGPDRVLCKDQTLPLDVSIADPLATYTWTKNGSSFSSAASVALVDPATYTARVADSNGCVNQDDITISRDETEIAADFVVATRLPKNQRVRITNISFPYPDSMEWIIPNQAQVMDQKPEYAELIFSDYGQFNVGLKSHKGECEKTTMQTVNVVTDAELADYQAPDEPYIKQFSVSPNPNNGKFTALVQLSEVGDYKLVFYSPQGILVSNKEVKGYAFATTDFDVSAQVSAGVYVLQLITTQGLSYVKIVIQ